MRVLPAGGALLAAALLALTGCAGSARHQAVPASRAPSSAAVTPPAAPEIAAAAALPRPAPAPNPCAGNVAAQLVLVDVSEQTAWLCATSTLVRASPVTTGETDNGDDTPTGTWQITSRQTDRNLYTRDGGVYHVQYWLPFQDELYGFHDASWQTIPFGSQAYHSAGSHGCVHMPVATMAFLYAWAKVGTTVTIRA